MMVYSQWGWDEWIFDGAINKLGAFRVDVWPNRYYSCLGAIDTFQDLINVEVNILRNVVKSGKS